MNTIARFDSICVLYGDTYLVRSTSCDVLGVV